MAINPKVILYGLGFLVFIGIGIVLGLYLPRALSVSPTTVQVPDQAPDQAPAPKPAAPPYTSSQDALANKFFCNGPCIS